MSTIKTGYWVRAVGGVVKDCWDYKPSDEKINSEAGWREAVEVIPDITPNREYVSTHTFDLTKTPAEIVWSKASLSVDDRRGSLKSQAKGIFQLALQEQTRLEMSDNAGESLDLETITTARSTLAARVAALDAAVTHEDIDALM